MIFLKKNLQPFFLKKFFKVKISHNHQRLNQKKKKKKKKLRQKKKKTKRPMKIAKLKTLSRWGLYPHTFQWKR